jgi:hypothetical protein
MATTSSCAGIIPNPDLAGIGVSPAAPVSCRSDQLTSQTRLNFYVTILITALIPPSESTTELLDSLYLNAIFTDSPFS